MGYMRFGWLMDTPSCWVVCACCVAACLLLLVSHADRVKHALIRLSLSSLSTPPRPPKNKRPQGRGRP